MVTCAVMANMPLCKRVIEVACGPGVHSKILATSFLNRDGGVQVSCDYSGGMVKKLKETFEQDGDYTLAPGNKFLMDSETDYNEFVEGSTSELKNKCDLDKIVGEQGTFNKFVYGCQANNEVLPFPSDYFEAYLAPLSLMLVNSHKNMISEAYRVTKSGSRSVFTIWGNEEKSLMFTLAKVIVRRYVPDYEANHISSNFDLWRDKGAQLKIDLESAGFVSIKMWEQPMNVFVG
jgi:ubiquinone/menaquinone biosynthesis C-methylase UbiE